MIVATRSNAIAHELCAHPRARYGDAIVLIAVSGAAPSPSDTRARESFALADGYNTKPVTVEMLSRVLRPLV